MGFRGGVRVLGQVFHRLAWEHQPHPSSSEHPQTDETRAHVSTHCLLHDERHVLCEEGHSRQVVVHLFAGAHTPREEHQPQPGARAEQPQTSVAVAQSEAEETLRESGGGIAKRALVLGGRERSNVKKSADVGAHVSEGRKQSILERDLVGCVGVWAESSSFW